MACLGYEFKTISVTICLEEDENSEDLRTVAHLVKMLLLSVTK